MKENYVEKFNKAVERYGKKFYELRNHTKKCSEFYSLEDKDKLLFDYSFESGYKEIIEHEIIGKIEQMQLF